MCITSYLEVAVATHVNVRKRSRKHISSSVLLIQLGTVHHAVHSRELEQRGGMHVSEKASNGEEDRAFEDIGQDIDEHPLGLDVQGDHLRQHA